MRIQLSRMCLSHAWARTLRASQPGLHQQSLRPFGFSLRVMAVLGAALTALRDLQANHASFVPHYMHRRCMDTPERCAASCINHGRYCAFDSILDEHAAAFEPRQVLDAGVCGAQSAGQTNAAHWQLCCHTCSSVSCMVEGTACTARHPLQYSHALS